MDFISERIEAEGDLEYFDAFGFKDNLGKEFKPFWWAIDRESDIFLFFCEGEASDRLLKCGLCINKELVEIQMQNKTEKKEEKPGLFVHWIINKIVIPVSLIERGCVEDDIVYIIENALIAIGLPGVSEKEVAETTVELKTRPMITENANLGYNNAIEESNKKEKKLRSNGEKEETCHKKDSFIENLKKGFIRENAKFRNISSEFAPIILIIWIVLVVIAMIIDLIYNKKIGFVQLFSAKITLIIMGVFTAVYWFPKIIYILIESIYEEIKGKERKDNDFLQ